MIIQHRQRMTTLSIQHRHVPLEVHLPQLVGQRLLETHECPVRVGLLWPDQPLPPQDLTNRAGRWQRRPLVGPLVEQHTPKLAWPPRRMPLPSLDDQLLDGIAAARRTAARTPRLVRQTTAPLTLKPLQPLV